MLLAACGPSQSRRCPTPRWSRRRGTDECAPRLIARRCVSGVTTNRSVSWTSCRLLACWSE
jgi:hypothetical protein